MTRLSPALFGALSLALGLMAPITAMADGDPVNGEKVFKRCMACHTAEAGGPNKVGPHLHGVVGRAAGSVEDFRYSDAMKNSGITWTPDKLNEYLTNPKVLVPGNKMAFVGLPKDQDRADVISYLQQQSR